MAILVMYKLFREFLGERQLVFLLVDGVYPFLGERFLPGISFTGGLALFTGVFLLVTGLYGFCRQI